MDKPTIEARLENAQAEYEKVFGHRAESACTVPYSVLLAGDGADLSVATDVCGLYLVGANDSGESRLRAKGFAGVCSTDAALTGPYQNESENMAGVLRGVNAAFKHFGYKTIGVDIYADSITLPQQGLDEPSHLAISLAFIYNKLANGGLLSEKRLAEAVQWTLANYMLLDSYITDTYSSIQGKTLSGNFKSTQNPVIKEIDLDMTGCSLYVVNIGGTNVDMPEEEVDPRLDSLIVELGREPDEMSEKDFYSKLMSMKNIDKEAVLFLMDYYTQENLENIYSANAKSGTGSPSMGQSLDFKAEKSGIAATEPEKAQWMQLCCVGAKADGTFKQRMEALFGTGCTHRLASREGAAKWIM